ncbi:DUF4142 domain-containing protein [Roseisolibacter agri]|uniref:DUF4142 domain-containing protein n=1 Tax=Roseisolibacter agri TaxID=2014610 RepID=A0AA37V8Z8_9BACT|nr:DUF4142 domain-containing protein [Roseisolibacter agri]GLC23908.1 hypothetical protein rosag_04210 [Roseisolibacter agri]
MRRTTVLAAILATTSAACGPAGRDVPADTNRAAVGDTAAVAGGPLTERGVLTLMSALNGAEIGAAKGVMSRIGDPTVRRYAQAMVADHGAMDSAVKALPLNDTPLPVPPAQFITMHAASSHLSAVLGAMPAGPALDRAYVASQVADHSQAMDSLRHWRGAVRDGGLRTALDGALAKVQEHLDEARAIQSALGGGVDSAGSPRPVPQLRPAEIFQAPAQLDQQRPDTATARSQRQVRPDTTRRDSARATGVRRP